MQNPLLVGWRPRVYGMKLTLLWSLLENRLPRFPQATVLAPSPKFFVGHNKIVKYAIYKILVRH
jgi:hypothetical protein